MEELMEMFDSIIGDALLREKAMEDEFTEFEKKLNDCVSQANDRGTPVQNKKRPKRQVSTSKRENNSSKDVGEDAQKRDTDHESLASNRSSARMLDVSSNSRNTTAKVLQPTVIETNVRPSRAARLKAQEHLKEPSLNAKMRNDSISSVVVKTERPSTVGNSTMVKDGKDAYVGIVDKTAHRVHPDEGRTFVEMETENDANHANTHINAAAHQLRKDEGFGSTNESSEKEELATHVGKGKLSRDASLMVIAASIPKVEILSDEEMPPPKMPPPKAAPPKVRTKKKAPPVKDERDADETASSSAVSSAGSSIDSTSSTSATSTTGRRPRGRPPGSKASEPKVSLAEPATEPVRIKQEKLSMVKLRQQETTKAPSRTSDKSVYEDAQEQQEQPVQSEEKEFQLRTLQIVVEKLVAPSRTPEPPKSDLNGTYSVAQPSPADATYGVPPTILNGTFTVGLPHVAASCNETFNMATKKNSEQSQEGVNDTFVIEKSDNTAKQHPIGEEKNVANASIMTEDDSVVENSPNQAPIVPVVKPKLISTPSAALATKSKKGTAPPAAASSSSSGVNGPSSFGATASSKQPPMKNHKELFNPCIMSPIKSRIQAFEKCATTATGTLTKATTSNGTPQARLGRILKTISTPSLATTPQYSSLDSLGSAHSAHAKETHFTPNCASQPIPKASSASKIHQMQSKALQHKPTVGNAGAPGSSRSLSRDSSWDRGQAAGGNGTGGTGGTLSAASSTSSLLDEKKKKREEKQRLAAVQREAMEREKREHAERMMREKEEKHRKLVHEKQEKLRIDASKKAKKQVEFEKRRVLEEQRALADEKRDQLAKQLEQQRIDREVLESLGKIQMKEHQSAKLHKQLQQQKLRQQQQLQQELMLQQQAAAKKKDLFMFEMIDTDDTTDDEEAEDTAARKKKRPPIPAWCRNTAEYRQILTIQAQVEPKVIDRLFSVQPMTPDLRALFPSIDAHKLKRNSSAIWGTPPRYSQLP